MEKMHSIWVTAIFISMIATVVAVSPIPTAGPYRSPELFDRNFYAGWRPDYTWLEDDGRTINIKLDNESGSGFQSKNTYLYGYVSMSIKLVPGNSAGIVVAYYMSSPRTDKIFVWDEIDFEFLGNVTGQPWILQTNLFANGIGGREEMLYLWFDPTANHHTYSILWNSRQIVWYVDDKPIRVYRNTCRTRARFPGWRAMNVYSSIWNADNWATRGGQDKTDWTYAPFVASYTNFSVYACNWEQPGPPPTCFSKSTRYWWDRPNRWTLNRSERSDYTYIRQQYMVYDYCKDVTRYPVSMPECSDRPW
ncbi:hypothetical protein KP509_11G011400 [Ceratopteris richardii]|uniref:Xyloglucan endotransglucosylase/hydrolase n=1 Tax=Ceratopteris richardii TaxID=49495 RepID=A0A8T2TP16_CERRI|nr:hypothetical protein KP509_11G011400 [Ceratopteris richardii]